MKTKLILLVALCLNPYLAFSEEYDSLTVAQAIEIGLSLEERETTTEYYVITGYVSAIETDLNEYKNQTFWITDSTISIAVSSAEGAFAVYCGKTNTEIKRGYKISVTTRIQHYRDSRIESYHGGVVNVLEENELPIDTTCGNNLIWHISDSVLTISGIGQMTNYQSAAQAPWRPVRKSIKSVVISSGVTSIGDYAFGYCENLDSIFIPEGVVNIGNRAFINSNLKSITIPNSITNTGTRAFYGCYRITSPIYNSHLFVYFPQRSYSGAYIIPDGIEKISGLAFFECSGITSVEIPNSVIDIGGDAFCHCYDMEYIYCRGDEPATIQNNVFYNTNECPIYVPCGSIDKYRTKWSEYTERIQYEPYDDIVSYGVELKSNIDGAWTFNKEANIIGPSNTICEYNRAIITIHPNIGYQFISWADGNTDNPRTIELTQDTTVEAIFDYLITGKCGKDSVLTWTLDTTTLALNISGKGALSENYTYGKFIQTLTIGNEITQIGQGAFSGFSNLKNIIIGSSVKVLEYSAFAGCSTIESITCYSQRPPTVNEGALYGLDYSTIVYVPVAYLNAYVMHDAWGLYDIRPLGAQSIETTEIMVNPMETTAEVVWSSIEGAATYELVIRDKSGNVICTLIFNANGQLTSIAFNAPGRNIPQQTQAAGFSFTVTGLEEGKAYELTLTSKDNAGTTIDEQVIAFTTGGEQGIDQIESSSLLGGDRGRLIIKDNQILILRGDHTYTVDGRLVR